MNLEDEAKQKLQDQINGKGIFISHSWDIRIFERFFKKLFGKNDDQTEDQNDGSNTENR